MILLAAVPEQDGGYSFTTNKGEVVAFGAYGSDGSFDLVTTGQDVVEHFPNAMVAFCELKARLGAS